MKVPDLLRAALALLDEPEPDTATVWPRGAAVLTRQAIETTLDAYWRKTSSQMLFASAADRWVALPSYLGRDPVIRAAEYAWSALSEACHQRAYDVGLTEAELRAHLRTADAFREVVAQALTTARGVGSASGPADS
ncbi:hypothetical protein NBH00_03055 [Paraconexibacter antarcticus]|uniref:SAV-6107-like HEPN domain-containing protein n=1 Tax=Paraconexibacter antarcticus TaxID=2949664 RepID=A0ABY5DT43_9ACTN|nr:hypothetical protein [Paraconexibacter antarcticus]UTI65195.1 hypothetical protein NBH00_03055 [Paraconexibacter antarcticus]